MGYVQCSGSGCIYMFVLLPNMNTFSSKSVQVYTIQNLVKCVILYMLVTISLTLWEITFKEVPLDLKKQISRVFMEKIYYTKLLYTGRNTISC